MLNAQKGFSYLIILAGVLILFLGVIIKGSLGIGKEKLDTKKLFTIPQNEELFLEPIFSPDHKHFAYTVWSHQTNDSYYYVVHDGNKHKPYGNPDEILTFSPDSKRLAYVAGTRGGKSYVAVVDNKESAAYERIFALAFSPDSKRFAFIGYREGKTVVVMDNVVINSEEEQKQYDSAFVPSANLVFSPDGKQLAYYLSIRSKNKSHIVRNGKELGPYDNISASAFSPDGKRLAYVAKRGDEIFVVDDGKEGNKYAGVIDALLFSPDGKQLVYRARKLVDGQEKLVLVQNGRESQPFEDVTPLAFSQDGTKLAYKVYTSTIYINDKEVASYPSITGGSFSPDGEKFAFIASMEGRTFLVVDGKELGNLTTYSSPKLLFSPDGKHIAYVAQADNNGFYISLDGKAGKIYDYVNEPSFSEDGKTLIYNARLGQELWLIVEDINSR